VLLKILKYDIAAMGIEKLRSRSGNSVTILSIASGQMLREGVVQVNADFAKETMNRGGVPRA
jgi:hypothetical protein